jgi:SAM-dependent methyltransferase
MVPKVVNYLREQGLVTTLHKVCERAPEYVAGIKNWQFRRCGCCRALTVFFANNIGPEFSCCLFCSANGRYEMLGRTIRSQFATRLHEMRVLELDPHSPLRGILKQAREYHRSFYSDSYPPGAVRAKDGARCEDIAQLTFRDGSLELIVSSDVLEHVPDLGAAFGETARVLVPGGVHLFTVPTRDSTQPRAVIDNGSVRHLLEPEYHLDPLSPHGILAFWNIGLDLPKYFKAPNLEIRVVDGPLGPDRRIVWAATRKS